MHIIARLEELEKKQVVSVAASLLLTAEENSNQELDLDLIINNLAKK